MGGKEREDKGWQGAELIESLVMPHVAGEGEGQG